MALESNTRIRIDPTGRWWDGDSPIIHEGILKYFKANLHREKQGRYFILNTHGPRVEIGWVPAVQGFPVLAEQAALNETEHIIRLSLDSGQELKIPFKELYVGGEDLLWTFRDSSVHERPGPVAEIVGSAEEPIPVRLGPGAMRDIGKYLEPGRDGHWFLNAGSERIPLESAPPPKFDAP